LKTYLSKFGRQVQKFKDLFSFGRQAGLIPNRQTLRSITAYFFIHPESLCSRDYSGLRRLHRFY